MPDKKRVSRFLFAAMFMAVLLAGLVILVLKPKAETSYYENRMLAEAPRLSLAALWDGSFFSDLESYLSDHAPGRESLLYLHTELDLNVLRRPVVNSIISADKQLVYHYSAAAETEEETGERAALAAQRCASINELVQSYGGTFLFVSMPSHSNYFSASCPSWLMSGTLYYELANELFLSEMAELGVPALDMADCFDAAGHPDSFYYATDHHITLSGALCTYEAIIERLNSLSGGSLPVYTEDDLETVTLPNPFLGSRARAIYGITELGDSLTYGTWLMNIPFSRYDNGVEVEASTVTLPDSDTETVGYTCFMGGDIAETSIQTGRSELPSLLIWGDSFTNCIESLIYADFDETRSLDLRYYEDMSLTEYIEEYKPEYVICVRDYSSLLNTDGNGAIE